MNGAPLDFVAVEKRLPTPALKHRSDFPTQIDRIRDPEVHAEAAKGRVKMAGIACQEDAALLVTISKGTTGFPDITPNDLVGQVDTRSEEHTSELQSLMRISYAVFCLKKKKKELRIR